MTTRRKLLRFGLSLVWGLVMLVILAVFMFGGMVGGAYLGFKVLPGWGFLLAVGAFAGFFATVFVCHNCRGWLLRARLRKGTRAEAHVVWCGRLHTSGGASGPGSTIYTVYVRWDGVTRERQYRFNGRGPAFDLGATVPVRYPPGRPRRFQIDLPYAPTMVDFFI